MRYANLKLGEVTNPNYGDVIQYHAIKNLYTYMGIDYNEVFQMTDHEMLCYSGEEYLVMPLNIPFWGMYDRLPSHIIPVYLGISLKDECQIDALRLREFQPIGCRDQYTFNLLTDNGIRAYLNGCMTITLPKRDSKIVGDKVFLIDVCDEVYERIPLELRKDAIIDSHVKWGGDCSESTALAAYEDYKKNAKLVISSRLHCIVPCIAYGIPVIYANPTIPTRMDWLHKIIPLYNKNNFDKIDWHPHSIDIESLKKVLLENAVERVQKTWNRYYSICKISEFYEDKDWHIAVEEDLIEARRYMEAHWNQKDEHTYVIWGGSATAPRLYKMITNMYPYAKMVSFIDMYRSVKLIDAQSDGLEALDRIKADTVVFIAAERANMVALSELRKRKHREFVICWNMKGDTALQEAIRSAREV